MDTKNLLIVEPTPEQAVALLMADKIQCWIDQIPKWRRMPRIAGNEANFNRAIAATQIAKASGRLMRSTSDVLNANIDGVLGHQARTAYELYTDAAWLRMKDGDGRLSEQFMTWHLVAMHEINGRPEFGAAAIQEARRRYGDRLNRSPDEWTVIEGERTVTNSNNRRQAVAAKLEGEGLEGIVDVARGMFRMLNTLSHGVTATATGGEVVLTRNIMTGCYLTTQECQDWLCEMAGGFPDHESEVISKLLWKHASECLT
ncbi:MAG: hypothetical protein OXI54_02100 [Chloroflexota bacterium]|nr:hypothetical protein [Chloroflexota bacterium]MDE2682929.1 hypothetical protein [Chloroflexota bacterium]